MIFFLRLSSPLVPFHLLVPALKKNHIAINFHFHVWHHCDTLSGLSCPIWVKHRLSKVEHCTSHMGGPVAPLGTHQKWSWVVSEAPKTAISGQIWQNLATDGPSCPIWVEHWMNKVEHCFPHLRELVGPLWTHRNGPVSFVSVICVIYVILCICVLLLQISKCRELPFFFSQKFAVADFIWQISSLRQLSAFFFL